ncbi:MAG TPA: ATPase domain-containing protein [Terriglobales bacterium]|nr:ATPase domain-containing protein [Terriglobales bacterium]
MSSTGVPAVDELLDGGLPVGAMTEISGEECSGRSTLAFSFLSQRTREGKVCAWIDVSNAFQPEVAAASRIDLRRLLWVRCGTIPEVRASAKASFQLPKECLTPPPEKKGLYAGGWGAHPRSEVKGLADAVGNLFQTATPREQVSRIPQETRAVPGRQFSKPVQNVSNAQNQLERINQARRVTDLLLQGGGFSAIVLDMGGIAPEYSLRVPLDTWFRYRAAAERTQTSLVLLTQRPCAKSSAGLVLRLGSTKYSHLQAKVFTRLRFHIEVERQRFMPTSNVVPLRKGPQQETGTQWDSRCSWAARR